MLVLSRHRDGQIMIGDDIVVTVVEIRGDKVRLGIDAPKAVAVHRREVYEALKQKAAQGQPVIVAEAVSEVKAKTMAEYIDRNKSRGL